MSAGVSRAAVIALLVSLGCAPSAPAVLGPQTVPDHALGVGVRTFDLVDTTRGTPANGTAPARPERDLPTRVWYPSVANLEADEVRNAEPDPGPWPLIVFVHGSSGTPSVYAWFGRAMARAGYVVVAADMPSTSFSAPGGPTDLGVEEQPRDVAFLADRAFAGDLLPASVIDARPGYVVAGHSTGGTVALLAGYAPDADPRVAAVVPLSGDACFFADTFFSSRSVPLLAVSGTDDLYVPPLLNAERTYALALAPKTLVVLSGGTHLGFTDLGLADDPSVVPDQPGDDLPTTLSAYGDASACNPIPARSSDPTMALADQHRITAAWVVAFLDALLRDAPEALDALHASPELALVRSE